MKRPITGPIPRKAIVGYDLIRPPIHGWRSHCQKGCPRVADRRYSPTATHPPDHIATAASVPVRKTPSSSSGSPTESSAAGEPDEGVFSFTGGSFVTKRVASLPSVAEKTT